MFTLNQIKEAHAKVNSGADFPQYIRDLVSLGIQQYTIYVYDGHAEYSGKNDYNVVSDAEYPTLLIADKIDKNLFGHYLKKHQQGATDYPTFCKNSAQTGVSKWVVDIISKTCTYYGKSNELILKEDIPI